MSNKVDQLKELRDKARNANNELNRPTPNDKDKENNMYVNVLIRDKKFHQFCGDGTQKLRWLTDCAIFKYENATDKKGSCGIAYGLKSESGALCNLENTIKSTLQSGSNVMVLLKEEYDVEMEERSKGGKKGYLEELKEFEDDDKDKDKDKDKDQDKDKEQDNEQTQKNDEDPDDEKDSYYEEDGHSSHGEDD